MKLLDDYLAEVLRESLVAAPYHSAADHADIVNAYFRENAIPRDKRFDGSSINRFRNAKTRHASEDMEIAVALVVLQEPKTPERVEAFRHKKLDEAWRRCRKAMREGALGSLQRRSD